MAAESKKMGEGEDLSMEEILQSIRKIIADEDKPAETSVVDEPIGAVGSDVLELTDIIEESPTRDVLKEIDDALETETFEAPQEETVLEQAEEEPVTVESIMVPENTQNTTPIAAGDRLISDQAAAVSAKAFQKVIQTHKATTPMPHFRNNETIEDLVLETLKPLLKEWLDAHLPSMVERIVEREISKLVE